MPPLSLFPIPLSFAKLKANGQRGEVKERGRVRGRTLRRGETGANLCDDFPLLVVLPLAFAPLRPAEDSVEQTGDEHIIKTQLITPYHQQARFKPI